MGTRWTTAIQRAVDDVAHAGPELETAGGAFRLMAEQAGARGRATDAAVSVAKAGPNGGAGAWGHAGRIPRAARESTGRGDFFR
jgi:hypothetical protein